MADTKKLVCPRCHVYWADLDFADYPALESRHLKILFGDRKRPRNGESIRCSACRYEYTTWDVVIAGASPSQREDLRPGEKATA